MGKVGDFLRKGLWAPVRAILPKNPWLRVLVYALPIVLVLALFGPALDVVLKLMELGMRLIEPLLQTTVGRVLLLLVVIALGTSFLVWLLRRRVQDTRANATLGRHLQATAALIGLDRRKSRERFRRVARYRGPLPDRYPHVVQDANLKLARQCLEDGRVDDALGWLARVIEPKLPSELTRSLLQLRLQALRRQGDVLPATLRREAEHAVNRFPKDAALLTVLRELLEEAGELDEALTWQEQIARHAPPATQLREQQRLVDMLVAAGERALAAGERDHAKKIAKKLQKADPDGIGGKLLLGDLHRAAGELRQAVRVYGSTRSPTGLDRIAELLSDNPRAVEPRELLANCPMQGGLLLVARELARVGELDRAERAARVAAEALGPTPTVCAVLAEVLDLLGHRQRAHLLRQQTVAKLLASTPADGGAAAN